MIVITSNLPFEEPKPSEPSA
ncbi:hypothetical protein OB2597_05955 [Pseudooceanicola batsensis HTCC2597]|uniref:Uncharacterized protein n=1 Tax=Pseudooceanicola batsensis (strain ATCC BAA-863 / DSM 15984 / KCTC 12145 / HTCC2597) TaxID=252305 RepID=A3TT26_PSEBH|nr:hypothetical protein OB2597_05955 [Pseudooceanicola batsensis HTCC2597]